MLRIHLIEQLILKQNGKPFPSIGIPRKFKTFKLSKANEKDLNPDFFYAP